MKAEPIIWQWYKHYRGGINNLAVCEIAGIVCTSTKDMATAKRYALRKYRTRLKATQQHP